MPEPSMGQPFIVHPGLRISVGYLGAVNGTPAQRGVVILENGIESNYVISPNLPFQVQAQVRTVLAGANYPLPPELTVEFRIYDLVTGALHMGPITGSAPVVMTPAPVEDPVPPTPSPSYGPEIIVWYAINTPVINPLPVGAYRITVIGRANYVFFIHDDTELLVQ